MSRSSVVSQFTKGITLALLVSVMLTGCVSGNRFTVGQVSQIEPGITTESELVESFGEPTSFHLHSDGSKTLGWSWSYAAIGWVRSGAKTLTVRLGADGKTKEYGLSSYTAPTIW